MFNNIGKKIMKIAKICFWIGVIGSLIIGAYAWYDWLIFGNFGDFVVCGIVPAVFCAISAFLMYGFGQLVEDTHEKKAS